MAAASRNYRDRFGLARPDPATIGSAWGHAPLHPTRGIWSRPHTQSGRATGTRRVAHLPVAGCPAGPCRLAGDVDQAPERATGGRCLWPPITTGPGGPHRNLLLGTDLPEPTVPAR